MAIFKLILSHLFQILQKSTQACLKKHYISYEVCPLHFLFIKKTVQTLAANYANARQPFQ